MGSESLIEKGTKDTKDANSAVDTPKNGTKDPNRVRFTQIWSTGHVGTRFLTGLIGTPISNKYMVWNEYELPLMRQIADDGGSKKIWVPNTDMSFHEFKKSMTNAIARKNGIEWYGGKVVKHWNSEGDTAALRTYLEEKRIPALRSVYERYKNPEDGSAEKLNHFIKAGHTSIFFDLSDYYEVLSSASLNEGTTTDVDFVRIRRNRIDVANSFVSQKNKQNQGPDWFNDKDRGIVTNPTMRTTLLRFESLGGPLPDDLYRNWTHFQQYLWFCDEIEARWRVFRNKHPDVRHYELSYASSDEYPDKQILPPSSIDDMALNFLEIGHSLSPFLKSTDHRSHKTDNEEGMTREEKEKQAIAYSKDAPWCLQYEGVGENTVWDNYPKLDCGLSA